MNSHEYATIYLKQLDVVYEDCRMGFDADGALGWLCSLAPGTLLESLRSTVYLEV